MVLGKVKSLTISFDCLNDSNVPVYSSGDTVSGRVSLEVTGEIRVKSLKIHARGHAKVRWTESRNAGSNTAYTQNYTEEVEYFNHKDILIGHERGKDCDALFFYGKKPMHLCVTPVWPCLLMGALESRIYPGSYLGDGAAFAKYLQPGELSCPSIRPN